MQSSIKWLQNKWLKRPASIRMSGVFLFHRASGNEVAISATMPLPFAIAKERAALHIWQAFQASSPKTYQGRPFLGWPFFLS
jgi:hypothetical protein